MKITHILFATALAGCARRRRRRKSRVVRRREFQRPALRGEARLLCPIWTRPASMTARLRQSFVAARGNCARGLLPR